MPDSSYAFIGWTVSTDSSLTNYIDNPLTITLTGGTTYTIQPNFDIVLAPPGVTLPIPLPINMTNVAILVVLAAAGGSSSPAPGTYAINDPATLKLNATANSGWQFSHWMICGSSMNHGGYPLNYAPTDNPYTVGHGYGYTYYYQPVFTQVGSASSTPTASSSSSSPSGVIGGLSIEMLAIIALIIVIIIMAIGFAAYTVRRKN